MLENKMGQLRKEALGFRVDFLSWMQAAAGGHGILILASGTRRVLLWGEPLSGGLCRVKSRPISNSVERPQGFCCCSAILRIRVGRTARVTTPLLKSCI